MEFKSTRTANFFLGVGLLLIPAGTFYLAIFGNEHDFLNTRTRRGGFIKLIEQSIGWDLFVVLMLAFGTWALVYACVSLWKAIDSTPDVTAFEDHIEFHPAVRRQPASYEDIDYWSIEIVSGHPVLWIYFLEPYWSLQGLFRRKTVKLEGDRQQLSPLVEFFDAHPLMRDRFVS